jgi:hypothetical protein
LQHKQLKSKFKKAQKSGSKEIGVLSVLPYKVLFKDISSQEDLPLRSILFAERY